MALTGTVIRQALASVGALGGQMFTFDQLAADAASALRTAPKLTVPGAAGFLATLAMESAWFRTTQEYTSANTARYDPYRGRTFIQLTFADNYRLFGQWCAQHGLVSDPHIFVTNPASLAAERWAWLGGVFFMEHNGLWRYANAGEFLHLSQGVNGGTGRIGTSFVPYGWAQRKTMYDTFLAHGTDLLPATTPLEDPPMSAAEVKQLSDQIKALQADVDVVKQATTGDIADGGTVVGTPRQMLLRLYRLLNDPITYTIGGKSRTGSLRSLVLNARLDANNAKNGVKQLLDDEK